MTKHILPRSFVSLLAIACGACFDPADGDAAADASESSGDPDPSTSTTAGTTAGTTASTTAGTSASTTAETSDDGADESSGEADSSGDESSSTDAPAESSSDETAGATVPSIVETAPFDGEIGVRDDVAFVVRFSEPMDQAATQAAYQSADVPAAGVTFAWNDAGDELTVTPNAPLAYAMGELDVIPLDYAFTITTAARSAAGVMLADDVDVGFTTLRRISQVVERDPELSGNVGDVAGPIGTQFVGDRNTNEPVRYAVSFDAAELAPGVAELESAQLRASWTSQGGNPWAGLGGGTVFQHVSFAGLDEAFDAPAEGSASGLFGGVGDVDVMRDVATPLSAVLADLDGYGGLLQLRIRWLLDSDNDGLNDSVTLVPDELELHLEYLAP